MGILLSRAWNQAPRIVFVLMLSSTTIVAQWKEVVYNGGAQSLSASDSIVVVGGNNVPHSTNKGNNWLTSNSRIYCSVVICDKNRCYAAGNDSVAVSVDYANNWSLYGIGNNVAGISSMTISDSLIYVGTADVGTGNGGICLSSNGGGNWKKTLLTTGGAILSLANFGSHVLAGTWQSGVFVSSDRGDTWHSANNGLTSMNVYSLLVVGNQIFAATDNGIFTSDTSVFSWSPLALTGKHITCLYSVKNNIFAGTFFDGIYQSSDQGIKWSNISVGIGGDNKINCIAADSSFIYTATDVRLYKRAIGQLIKVTSVEDNGNPTPIPPLFLFNSTTCTITILGSELNNGTLAVKVFDSIGNEVSIRSENLTTTNNYSLEVSTVQLHTGVYFCIIRSGQHCQVEKFFIP